MKNSEKVEYAEPMGIENHTFDTMQ